MRLIHICGATWVDPEAIAAIKWNSASLNEHPTLILSDGTRLEAHGFTQEGTETAEDVTRRLLRKISRAATAMTP